MPTFKIEGQFWSTAYFASAAIAAGRVADQNRIDFSIASLAVLAQFRDLSIAKSRNRTFVGENELLKLAGSSAALIVIHHSQLPGRQVL